MKRFMMTVAATALIPAVALAESHETGDAMDPAADPMPMAADPDVAKSDDPEMTDKDMAAPKADASDTAKADTGLTAPVKASVIVGAPIYTLSASESVDWDVNVSYDTVADEWTRIGSIDDFIVDESGEIMGLVAEVGGFLGVGDKFVMLPMDETKMIMVSEADYAVVTPFTSDQLSEMERVE
ncbi:PRC-barrel domain-containing protein [Mameliella alba]|uniref:Glucose-6-phosphate isomerase n=1 Tax=Mameliella alba TaxID=561184 RepID=A0A0B3S0C1_9RHOB|nr:PRC-barrel domain-containing protein [Mameliella alba]KHQ53787.1 Glucose-6-phosphate isomerase [Mameliella alba]